MSRSRALIPGAAAVLVVAALLLTLAPCGSERGDAVAPHDAHARGSTGRSDFASPSTRHAGPGSARRRHDTAIEPRPVARGLVLGEDGAPVAGAAVFAARGDGGTETIASAFTDGRGRFELLAPPGDPGDAAAPGGSAHSDGAQVRVTACLTPGLVSGPRFVPPSRGGDPPEAILVLRAAARVTGRAVAEDGSPIAGAHVMLLCAPGSAATWESYAADVEPCAVLSGADGVFEASVPAGTVQVHARTGAPGAVYGAPRSAPTQRGATVSVGDVVAPAAAMRVRLRVQDPEGHGIDGAIVRLEPDDSVQRLVGPTGNWWEHFATAADGTVDLAVAPGAGPLSFAVGHRRFRPVEVTLVRRPGERAAVVTLQPKYEIRVSVRGPDGERPPGELEVECTVRPDSLRPRDFERIALDDVAPPATDGSREPPARVIDWRTDATRPERLEPDAEFVARLAVAGTWVVTVRTGPADPQVFRATVGPDTPAVGVTCDLPAGRLVRVDAGWAADALPGEDWQIWATRPGEWDDRWPRGAADWDVARARGASLVRTDDPAGSGPRAWWIPTGLTEFAWRDAGGILLARRSGETPPPLSRLPIPPGDRPTVVLDAPRRPWSRLVPVSVRLTAAGDPFRSSDWAVQAVSTDRAHRRVAATDAEGVARLRLPPGDYRIDVTGQFGPASPVTLAVPDDDAPLSVTLELTGRRW